MVLSSVLGAHGAACDSWGAAAAKISGYWGRVRSAVPYNPGDFRRCGPFAQKASEEADWGVRL
eukprot:7123523-Alexandrium_andersonii.AAC.1